MSGPVTDPVHHTPVTVRFYELDPYGHVNHGVYVNYFEVGRVQLLEAIGFGLPKLDTLGFRFVVVETTVTFLRSAVANDELVIATRLTGLKRVSALWEQQILRGDEVLVQNRLRSGITDSDGRPTAPPKGLYAALNALLATG